MNCFSAYGLIMSKTICEQPKESNVSTECVLRLSEDTQIVVCDSYQELIHYCLLHEHNLLST